MANISDVQGTIRFEHPNASTDLIEKLVDYTNEHFYYGSLIFGERFSQEFGTLWEWEWGEMYDFTTSGRWSFYSTLSTYFENFNDSPFKNELEGMVISVDYVDFEPGVELFVNENVIIEAVMKDGKLTTSERKYVTNDIDRNARNFENFQVAERAFDTFTEYGVANFKHYVTQFMAVEPDAFTDNPELRQLALHMRKIPEAELLQTFKDLEVVQVVDYEEGEQDEYQVTDILVEQGVIDHDLIKPYTK